MVVMLVVLEQVLNVVGCGTLLRRRQRTLRQRILLTSARLRLLGCYCRAACMAGPMRCCWAAARAMRAGLLSA